MSDIMNGNHNLLRKELFGGTLFLVKEGIRTYINQKEYQAIIDGNNTLTPALIKELNALSDVVIVRNPAVLPANNFSAPDTVYMEVTRACNLRCGHCFNDSGVALLKQLTKKQFELIIDNLALSGVQEIRFTGGEPLIFSGIISLIKKASTLGLRTSIGTNATLIDFKMAKKLAENGLCSAIVSLDGLEKHNDRIRGKDTFRRAIVGIKNLKKCNIDVRVNAVVMRSNFGEIISLANFLSNQGIRIFIRRLILSGRAANYIQEMLSEKEYEKLSECLKPYLNDSRSLVGGHYLSDKRFKTRISLPFLRKDCSAGQRGLVILPDGRIQTCGFLGPLGEHSSGNILTESFTNIWQKLIGSTHIAELEMGVYDYNNRRMLYPKTNCLAIGFAMRR